MGGGAPKDSVGQVLERCSIREDKPLRLLAGRKYLAALRFFYDKIDIKKACTIA